MALKLAAMKRRKELDAARKATRSCALIRIVSACPLASSLVNDRWPGVCRVSGATEEKIVRAIFDDGKSIDRRISVSLCVVGGPVRCLGACNRGWLRVFNRGFLGFLFGLRSRYLLSSCPRLFDLGYHCDCDSGACAEAVELC